MGMLTKNVIQVLKPPGGNKMIGVVNWMNWIGYQ